MTEKNLKHNNNLIKEQTQKYHIPVDVKAGGYGECLS
jgi:alanine racemase